MKLNCIVKYYSASSDSPIPWPCAWWECGAWAFPVLGFSSFWFKLFGTGWFTCGCWILFWFGILFCCPNSDGSWNLTSSGNYLLKLVFIESIVWLFYFYKKKRILHWINYITLLSNWRLMLINWGLIFIGINTWSYPSVLSKRQITQWDVKNKKNRQQIKSDCSLCDVALLHCARLLQPVYGIYFS